MAGRIVSTGAGVLVLAALLGSCGGGGSPATPTPTGITTSTARAAVASGSPASTPTPPARTPPPASPSPSEIPASPASGTPLVACAADTVTGQASSQGATGSATIALVLSSTSGPCHFDGSLTVIIEDQNGNPQRISGNGVATPVSANLPDSVVFTWSNWCAAQVPFKADIRLGGQTLLAPLRVASCTNPTAPSTLVVVPAS